MNIQQIRNNNKRKSLDPMKKQFRFNDIINLNNSFEHEKKKVLTGLNEVFAYNEVYIEASLIGGGKADVFVSDDGKAREILHSETEKQCLEKTKNYPCDVIMLRTD